MSVKVCHKDSQKLVNILEQGSGRKLALVETRLDKLIERVRKLINSNGFSQELKDKLKDLH